APALKQFVGLAKTPHQRLHETDGAFRVFLDRCDEVLIGRGKAFRITRCGDGRRSRSRIDQAHFAKHFASLKPANCPNFVAAADFDIDHPAHDEERGVALLPFTDDRLSGLERNLLHGASAGASSPATSVTATWVISGHS